MSNIFARIMVGDVEDYEQLIEGTDINIKNERSASLLMISIGYRRNHIALDLISRGAELDQKNGDDMTVLQTALVNGMFDVAIELISRGVDIENIDRYGNNALWYAATHPKRNLEIVRMILQHGSNPMVKNNAGRSVYNAARERNDIALLELLGAPDENFGE